MPHCLQFYMCHMGCLHLHICEETDIVCATLRVREYMHALIVVRLSIPWSIPHSPTAMNKLSGLLASSHDRTATDVPSVCEERAPQYHSAVTFKQALT